MSKRYQKTVFLSTRTHSPSPPSSPPPPPPPPVIPTGALSHYRSVETNREISGLKYDFRYKSEINKICGKPSEKLIEIPMTRDVPTKPPISSQTTVMSYKKGCELFQSMTIDSK
ncbi:unnamed protein product [Oppiella nova]|uniref:Uncharacterized protein n=1 Tax=Oppiella nova TaxID=334625 RepID=A0A7R9QZS6_9ACAR|nr:unnamed protein product [Oppiella nova]CAG2180226.1 unnamed protein product [Oppiella nova]